jgi:murein DD-endopeptidase MepM/ murein hydrolase activator NlpD
MKNLLFTLCIILSSHTLFAQTETQNSRMLSQSFEEQYNNADYDKIFAMFSPKLQAALPIANTNSFLKGLNGQAGRIVNRKFIKYDQSYASYLTTFEKKTFLVNISTDNNAKINGLAIKPYTIDTLPKKERNLTPLKLPFKEEWTVVWGGDTKELNYHVESESQKNAFDLLITDSTGRSFKGDGKRNADYYAFGKPLIAPADGIVVSVVDGVKDNVPGTMNVFNVGGNTTVIKTITNEYLVFCHLQHQSIKVKEGQKVKQGDFLGNCGNTGHSSEAHLHFHIQNIEDLNSGTGIKAFFKKLHVNGAAKEDYSPIKGDKIKQ